MQEDVEFYLAIWAAIISTVLGVVKIIEFKNKNRKNLHLIAKIKEPHDNLRIEITNEGSKPVFLSEIKIYYFNGVVKQLIFIKELESKRKVDTGDYFEFNISRKEIINAKTKRITQEHLSLLYVQMRSIKDKIWEQKVFIEPSLIENKKYIKRLEQYICADLFLGFEPRPLPPKLYEDRTMFYKR
jgi:hypothetical protein